MSTEETRQETTDAVLLNNIRSCARCGGDHGPVLAMPLDHPFAPEEAGGIAWTHWAPCPTNGQPILVCDVADVIEDVVVDAKIDACARAAHEANRAYCIAIGDHSQKPWHVADEWQRKSAREGVVAAIAGASPRELHEKWVESKRADGWVYGELKDPEMKTHPCMVPYEKLPAEQRAKDDIFALVVRALNLALGAR